MNSKDILKIAQQEKNDERNVFLRDKSSVWISSTLIALAGLVSGIRDSHNQNFYDIFAIVCISLAAGEFYKYLMKKNLKHLLLVVGLLLAGFIAAYYFLAGL
ncbi:DUF6442 family protein [Vaginisenegalia massiliensis]|uniref:DUF6442 family protein n=1 Tax=Vaginisenegalia massiliensis TaxID=2058294 RepID=UPI000F534C43|nr:DUF6442 family protein [Vaginisenegalia massiliensis]